MTLPELQRLAAATAHNYGLDPALIQSICHHESGNWQVWAIRYEPGFYTKYIATNLTMTNLSQTEKQSRAFSYGLMQIMGQVARELGFTGKYLTELCDPLTNLDYGCKKFKRCLDKADGDVRVALLSYNGGGDPLYPAKVLEHYIQYKGTAFA